MGNILRKRKREDNELSRLPVERSEDKNIIDFLRKELHENIEVFLVNNLLMSIQFFENYEREIKELRKNPISDREILLNHSLKGHQKHCLLPDVILDSVNKRVRFRAVHGPKKWQSEPIAPQRMFVIHDNIEVMNKAEEVPEYSIVDGPIHRCVLERSKHPGYVQVERTEILKKHEEDSEDTSKEKSEERETTENSTKVNDVKIDDIKEKEVEMNNKRSPDLSVTFNVEPHVIETRLSLSSVSSKQSTEHSVSFNTEPQTIDLSLHKQLSFKGSSPSPSPTRPKPSILKVPPSPLAQKELQFVYPEVNESQKVGKKGVARSGSIGNLSSLRGLGPKLRSSLSFENVSSNESTKQGESDKQSDEVYMYRTITNFATKKALKDVDSDKKISDIFSLPKKCVVTKKIKRPPQPEDVSSDEEEFDENGRRRPPIRKKIVELFDNKDYISSQEFIKHFKNVFSNIYMTLGFSKDALAAVTSQSSIIYINLEDESGNMINYEVYPAVATSWPETAFEWVLRKRNPIFHPHLNISLQWPRNHTVTKIRNAQASALPVGYMPKQGKNESFDLEWNLSFPVAEKHLEVCMNHSQMRCYLFILTLYKTFIEVPNPKLGLSLDHIRAILFWELEKNWTTWQEEQLGAKMLFILQRLYDCLAKGKLPDYFVRDKNLLGNTPSKYLHISQERIHKILESPFLHTLVAIRNLRYTSGTFFPTLDIKQLYKIVTINNAFQLINSALTSMISNSEELTEDEELNEFEENRKTFWNRQRESEDAEQKWKRRMRRQLEFEKDQKERELAKKRRGSVDSINTKHVIKTENFDTYRRRALLEFFVKHFVSMAMYCFKYQSNYEAMLYLNHSNALASLLMEEPSGHIEGQAWKVKIRDIIVNYEREIPPAVPARINSTIRSSQSPINSISRDPRDASSNNVNSNSILNQPSTSSMQESSQPEVITVSADIHRLPQHKSSEPQVLKEERLKLQLNSQHNPSKIEFDSTQLKHTETPSKAKEKIAVEISGKDILDVMKENRKKETQTKTAENNNELNGKETESDDLLSRIDKVLATKNRITVNGTNEINNKVEEKSITENSYNKTNEIKSKNTESVSKPKINGLISSHNSNIKDDILTEL